MHHILRTQHRVCHMAYTHMPVWRKTEQREQKMKMPNAHVHVTHSRNSSIRVDEMERVKRRIVGVELYLEYIT